VSNDDLTNLVNQLTRAIWDPTAPVPTMWPTGAWGVFLVFVTQIGAGIPLGVLMARNAGLSPLVTGLLYLASDVVLAVTTEPMLGALRWLGRRLPFFGRLGDRLARLSGMAGLESGAVSGAVGIIVLSFSVAPLPARAASEAAGYGFVPGWTLAIIGDMAYFTLVMVSTLWASSVFGIHDRLTVGGVIVGTWVLRLVMQRLRKRQQTAKAAAPLRVVGADVSITEAPRALPRRPVRHDGRRRRSSRGHAR
jgi:hypothetical protein